MYTTLMGLQIQQKKENSSLKNKEIHRDASKISDSDVSKRKIHRNSIKSGNPDVSIPPKPSKKSPIKQNNQPALPHNSIPSESPRKS